MDAIDCKALQHLMAHGRATWSELACLLGLSPPAVADRVRRLEERGVIRGYTALVDPEEAGYGLCAFVAITLDHPATRAPFLTKVESLTEALECHHIAGDDDYLLKVRCQNTRDLERLVSDEIKGITGVTRCRTTVVLSTVKETCVLPLSGTQATSSP